MPKPKKPPVSPFVSKTAPIRSARNPSSSNRAVNYTPPTSKPSSGSPSVGVQGFGGTVDSGISLTPVTGEILNITPGAPIGATVVDSIPVNLLPSTYENTGINGGGNQFFNYEGGSSGIQAEEEETNPIKKFLQKFMPVLKTDSDIKFDYVKISVVVGLLSVFIFFLVKFSKRK